VNPLLCYLIWLRRRELLCASEAERHVEGVEQVAMLDFLELMSGEPEVFRRNKAYILLRTTMSRTRLLLVLAGLLLLYPLFALRPYVTTKPYDVDEAYKVYSAILPTVGEHPLIIAAETRTPEFCLQPLDAQSEKVLRLTLMGRSLVGGGRQTRWTGKFSSVARFHLIRGNKL
jgi:hypothetical protein